MTSIKFEKRRGGLISALFHMCVGPQVKDGHV
jgi:hypothetical protein